MLNPALEGATPVTCQIVDTPDETAAVLVDLNDKVNTRIGKGQLSFGNPDLNPGRVESTNGVREIRVPLTVQGTQAAAELTLVTIARTLASTSPRWMLWKQTPTSPPTWFRLIRSPLGELDLSLVPLDGTAKQWRWDLTLTAEAFSYGARVTGTHRLLYRRWAGGVDTDVLSARLDDVKGDAPARVRVDIKPTGSMAGWSPWVNITAVPESAWTSGPTVWQAEAFTPGTGYVRNEISYGGPDPTAGNPYNVLKTNGTQNTQWAGARCASGEAPTLPLPGRYALLVRLITAHTGAIAPSFRWGAVAGPDEILAPTWSTWRKPAKSRQFAGWLNLGPFQFPAGMNPAGLRPEEMVPPTITLWHRGDGVNADVFVDKLLLVPVELVEGAGHNLTAGAPHEWYGAAANSTLRVDDMVRRVAIVTRDAIPRYFITTPPKPGGGFPYVTPGFDNWITVLPNVGVLGGDDSSGADTFDVEVSYHPRYLHLAGD